MASDLLTRTFSAVLLGVFVLGIAGWNAQSFAALCILGAIVLWREWMGLVRLRGAQWMLIGFFYIAAACGGLAYIRYQSLPILFALLVIVWTGDIAAYLVGRKLGNHKIAPAISPGKSWEGLGASIVASATVGALLGHVAPVPHAILGAVLAVVGLGGDLFESALKRHAGVKDSGRLIPGHGGLFDRVDALMPCAILAAVALYTRLHMQ